MNMLPYHLPDWELFQDRDTPYRYRIWQPEETCVVLGNSNMEIEQSVFTQAALSDHISVVQRPTGGQAVVLSPKMLVISILQNGTQQLPSQKYFQIYNLRIMAGLTRLSVRDLVLRGISDIAIGEKKIAGTALYRNIRTVFYHAVLNVGEDPEIMEKYLRYPSRTPEYRKGRSHREFVTSLFASGYELTMEQITENVAAELLLPPA